MTAALDLLCDAVAGYRLTRLVTTDTLTTELRGMVIAHAYGADRPNMANHHQGRKVHLLEQHLGRDAFLRADWWDVVVANDEDPPLLATLVTCRWCTGVWVGLAVMVARSVAPRPWRWVARALTIAAVGALLARLEDD